MSSTPNESNLDLLGIFHYVVGGLTALGSCFFLIYVALGIGMLSGALDEGGANPPPPGFGWFFIALGAVFILVGWALATLMILAGRKLRQRRSVTFCLVVAGIECIVMPFGTVLGIFTLILLNKPEVRALFPRGLEGVRVS